MVGTGRGAELGVLFRKGDALQSLAAATAIALDKTGTITKGSPALTRFRGGPGISPPPTCWLSSPLSKRVPSIRSQSLFWPPRKRKD